MRLREPTEGELTVYSREEFEYRFGPLPEGFPGDQVYIDQRYGEANLAERLPHGLELGEAKLEDLELAKAVNRQMARQFKAEVEFSQMALEAMQRKFGARVKLEAMQGDVWDEIVERWRRERGAEPPIRLHDEILVYRLPEE